MKVLYMTQWSNPDPFFDGALVAHMLSGMGHHVTVLSGCSSCPSGELPDGFGITSLEKEDADSVDQSRLSVSATREGSQLLQIAKNFVKAASASLASVVLTRPDVTYVNGRGGACGLLAVTLKTLRGVPFICDARNPWLDSLAAIGGSADSHIRRMVGSWENYIYRSAAVVVVRSDGFKDLLEARGITGEKISVVQEWAKVGQTSGLGSVRLPTDADGSDDSERASSRGRHSMDSDGRHLAETIDRVAVAGRASDPVMRMADIVVSFCALIALAGPMTVVWILVRVKLGRPAVFKQTRPGRYGQPFTMYKFRTMTDRRGGDGELLPDAARLTNFGKALRSSSLDELPELVNVLKGDMAIVGPRPLLMRYTPFFTDEERLRLAVRPGITGWAQVNGRNKVRWADRLALDVWYVRHRSLGLNARITGKTVKKVFKRDGLIADPESVMKNLDDERRGGEGAS